MTRVSAIDIYVVVQPGKVRDGVNAAVAAAGYCVRNFRCGAEFLAIADALRPGCVIAQLRGPDINGLELLKRLNALDVKFPLVLLSDAADVRTVVKALKSGAADFIQEPIDPPDLVSAIQSAEKRLLEAREGDFAKAAAARMALLTTRERDIFNRLISGMANKAIARDLRISPRTVEFHRSRLMAKMQASSLSDLVLLGIAAGAALNSELNEEVEGGSDCISPTNAAGLIGGDSPSPQKTPHRKK